MPKVNFNKNTAKALVREEAKLADQGLIDPSWEAKIEELSTLCQLSVSRTHIAFLGTAILAKALNRSVNLRAIKPEHADPAENSFSARTLCHSVLVPLAAEIGIHLGRTGREPLNNQPYFRMTRLGDDTPVHRGGRAAFERTMQLVDEIQSLKTEEEARAALRAFIAVRRKYQPRYTTLHSSTRVRPNRLASLISAFVAQDSENGKRAQAVAAGLLDIVATPERVVSGRINDPSHKYPGDVCIKDAAQPNVWEKAFEVRDKPVTIEDAQIFGKKCVDLGAREAALLLVSTRQKQLDAAALDDWAASFGIGMTLFYGWAEFVDQVLFWSAQPKPDAAWQAVNCINQRLIAIEASPTGVAFWQELVAQG